MSSKNDCHPAVAEFAVDPKSAGKRLLHGGKKPRVLSASRALTVRGRRHRLTSSSCFRDRILNIQRQPNTGGLARPMNDDVLGTLYQSYQPELIRTLRAASLGRAIWWKTLCKRPS